MAVNRQIEISMDGQFSRDVTFDPKAQLSSKIGGAQNKSAPFDLNLDLLKVFS